MNHLLDNLTVQHKHWLQIGSAAIGMIMIALLSLSSLHSNLLDDRRVKTRHLVENAHSVLSHFHARVAAGSPTQAAATLIDRIIYLSCGGVQPLSVRPLSHNVRRCAHFLSSRGRSPGGRVV